MFIIEKVAFIFEVPVKITIKSKMMVENLPAMQEIWVRRKDGNPLQYPCLENSMDRGAWLATIHVVPRVRNDLVTSLTHSL